MHNNKQDSEENIITGKKTNGMTFPFTKPLKMLLLGFNFHLEFFNILLVTQKSCLVYDDIGFGPMDEHCQKKVSVLGNCTLASVPQRQ